MFIVILQSFIDDLLSSKYYAGHFKQSLSFNPLGLERVIIVCFLQVT